MESRGTHGNHSQSKTDVGRLYTLSSLIVVGNSYEFLNGSLSCSVTVSSRFTFISLLIKDTRYATSTRQRALCAVCRCAPQPKRSMPHPQSSSTNRREPQPNGTKQTVARVASMLHSNRVCVAVTAEHKRAEPGAFFTGGIYRRVHVSRASRPRSVTRPTL